MDAVAVAVAVVVVVVVVMMMMGDSGRHKDISDMQPNGGWLTVVLSSLDSKESLEVRMATNLGNRRPQEAMQKNNGSNRNLQACVEGTWAG